MAAGGGSQTYTSRWGDYATMTLDPDGCTFWFTSEIYATTGSNWNTRIGSFAYPSCMGGGGGGGGGTTVPAVPSGLSATAASRTQINLTWVDASSDETGFKVERSTNGTTFTQIAAPAQNATSFSSTGLTKNKTYWYRVRATNAVGDSPYSNTASAKTPRN